MAELKDIYTHIKAPLVTEKVTKLNAQNKYAFWVEKRSNKIEIKKAIEAVYKVKVTSINIINMKGKSKRLRWGQEGRKSSWKKAFVTLKEGDQIKVT